MLFILNVIFTLVYLGWRLFFTVPVEMGTVSLVAGIILLSVEILGALEAFVHYFNMYKIEDSPLPTVPLNEFPEVDLFIATYNEPRDLLYKTINGCKFIDYPDQSKVHIYICDDGKRPEIKALAESMGVGYFDRENNEGAKAGNLNHALSLTSSPYVVTLDADMIPCRNFLMKTIPYFVEAEMKNRAIENEEERVKIGFVQSPQAFYNPDLFQFYLFSEKRIPNEQDYFYRDVQVARNRSNSVIYGGSNTVLSREALTEVGGFYTGSITEDFATGILIQKKKYKCIAISAVLASGLSPTGLKELLQQRIRWARGVISTCRKMHLIFTPHLTFSQKANYLASLWYWYSPLKIFIYIMAPILSAVFGFSVIKCSLLQILAFWLPMFITSNATLRMLSGNIRTAKWSRIYETILFPFMFFPVLLETFGISMKVFKVTSKAAATNEKGQNIAYSVPFMVFIILSVLGIYNCVRLMFVTSSLSSAVMLFWLIANLYSLVMSLFFLQGRDFFRKSERVFACYDCELVTAYETISCTTLDLSESGVSLQLEDPIYIDEKSSVSIHLRSDRYQADLKARIVHVDRLGRSWKYAFTITELPESSRNDYLQLLYDHAPTLPGDLSESISSFDDLRINVSHRVKDQLFMNRRLARVEKLESVHREGALLVCIVDFNYRYLSLKGENLESEMTIGISDMLHFDCSFEKELREGVVLYRINNIESIYHDPAVRKELIHWLESNPPAADGTTMTDTDGGDNEKNFDEVAGV